MRLSRGFKFHTHTPKSLLPYSVVIEGLSSDFSVGEMREFLLTETLVSMQIVGITNIAKDKWIFRLSSLLSVGEGVEEDMCCSVFGVSDCHVQLGTWHPSCPTYRHCYRRSVTRLDLRIVRINVIQPARLIVPRERRFWWRAPRYRSIVNEFGEASALLGMLMHINGY